MMEWVGDTLKDLVRNPARISWICFAYIVSYYIVSAFCIKAAKSKDDRGVWKKNGPLGIITSVIWFFVAILLIVSLLELSIKNQLSIGYLVIYYIFFIFLFAFCYGLLEWHFPGMLENIRSDDWSAEVSYVVISIQTQTTLGYSRVKPAASVTEVISAIQALLGLFFAIVFIAKAVSG